MSRAVRLVELASLGTGEPPLLGGGTSGARYAVGTACVPGRAVLSGRFLALLETFPAHRSEEEGEGGGGGGEEKKKKKSNSPFDDDDDDDDDFDGGGGGGGNGDKSKRGHRRAGSSARSPKAKSKSKSSGSLSPRKGLQDKDEGGKGGGHKRAGSSSNSSSALKKVQSEDVLPSSPRKKGHSRTGSSSSVSRRSSSKNLKKVRGAKEKGEKEENSNKEQEGGSTAAAAEAAGSSTCFSIVGLEAGPDKAPAAVALRKPIQCTAVLAHPTRPIVAARLGNVVQVFDVEKRARIGSIAFNEQAAITFWSWVRNGTALGVVDARAVHVWPNLVAADGEENSSNEGPGPVETVFGRPERFRGDMWQVTSLSTTADGLWTLVGGLRHDQRLNKVVGMVVLYNSEKSAAQCIEGYTACFGKAVSVHDSDRAKLRDVVVFANQDNRLTCASIDDGPRLNLAASLPSNEDGDFPVGVEIDAALGVVFVLTKLGRCLLVALSADADGNKASASVLCDEKISAEPVFTTSGYGESVVRPPGVVALNRGGSILFVTVDIHGILNAVRDNPDVQLVLQRRLTRSVSSRPELTVPRPQSAPSLSKQIAQKRAVELQGDTDKKAVIDDPESPSGHRRNLSASNPFLPTKELARGDSPVSLRDAPAVATDAAVLNPFLPAATAKVSDHASDTDSGSQAPPERAETPDALDSVFAGSTAETDGASLASSADSSSNGQADPPEEAEAEESLEPALALERWKECVEGEDFVAAAKLALSPGQAETLRGDELLSGPDAPSIGYYAALMQALQRPSEGTVDKLTEAEALALIRPTLFLGKSGVAQIRAWWEDGFISASRSVGDVVSKNDRTLGAEILAKIAGDADASSKALHLLTDNVNAKLPAVFDAAKVIGLLRDGNLAETEVSKALESFLARFDGNDTTSEIAQGFVEAAGVALSRETRPLTLDNLTRLLLRWAKDDSDMTSVILLRCWKSAIDRMVASEASESRACAVSLALSALKLASSSNMALEYARKVILEHGQDKDVAAAASALTSIGKPTVGCILLAVYGVFKEEKEVSDAIISALHAAIRARPIDCIRVLSNYLQKSQPDKALAIVRDHVVAAVRKPHDTLFDVYGELLRVSSLGDLSEAETQLLRSIAAALLEAASDGSSAHKILTSLHDHPRAAFDALVSHLHKGSDHATWLPHVLKAGYHLSDTADQLSVARFLSLLLLGEEPLLGFLPFGRSLVTVDGATAPQFCSEWLSAFSFAWSRGWHEEAAAAVKAWGGNATPKEKARLLGFVTLICGDLAGAGDDRASGHHAQSIVYECGGDSALNTFCVGAARWQSLGARVAAVIPASRAALAANVVEEMLQLQVHPSGFEAFKSACEQNGCDVSSESWKAVFDNESVAEYVKVATTVTELLGKGEASEALHEANKHSLARRFAHAVVEIASQSLDDAVIAALDEDQASAQLFADAFVDRDVSLLRCDKVAVSRVLKILKTSGPENPGPTVTFLSGIVAAARDLYVNAALPGPKHVGRNKQLQNTLLLTALMIESVPDSDDEEENLAPSLEYLVELCDQAGADDVAPHLASSGRRNLAAHMYSRAGRHADAIAAFEDAESAFVHARRVGSVDAWNLAFERSEAEKAGEYSDDDSTSDS